ncbi:hypothetical protein HF520_08560 [Romboutsia sp. CE17]|uniref:hypothetical protein n=1 Tax=Romboutsia sp. CE17 TaxID=2724150 RepID=UPI001442C4E4|nr:hypothetical protein [Romboutsia sp. CE17]QJA08996.1 hypothetical protein HF520_08560 [Romboutsia sp. CE17]
MVKIKSKILTDFIIYIASPIIIYMVGGIKFFNSNVFYLLLGLVIYSMYTKYSQNRITISGILIMILITVYIYFSGNESNDFNLYISNTYLFGIAAAVVLILDLFNKNIFNQIYIDVLNTKLSNKVIINSLIRKRKLEKNFNLLSNVIVLYLIIDLLIRIFSITSYGVREYKKIFNLEVLNLFIFLCILVYHVYKIILKTIEDKSLSNKDNLNKIKEGRVIKLNQYRKS